jgi:hypothetical protein
MKFYPEESFYVKIVQPCNAWAFLLVSYKATSAGIRTTLDAFR